MRQRIGYEELQIRALANVGFSLAVQEAQADPSELIQVLLERLLRAENHTPNFR